jgi:hypothetical protein
LGAQEPLVPQGVAASLAAWIGTRRLFDACGFEIVGNPDGGK